MLFFVIQYMYDLSIQQIKEEMRNGKVALEKYVITKALTKSPEAYPDSKSQPHVQVSMGAIIRIIAHQNDV